MDMSLFLKKRSLKSPSTVPLMKEREVKLMERKENMFEKKRNLVEEIIEIWWNKEREIWLIEEM